MNKCNFVSPTQFLCFYFFNKSYEKNNKSRELKFLHGKEFERTLVNLTYLIIPTLFVTPSLNACTLFSYFNGLLPFF